MSKHLDSLEPTFKPKIEQLIAALKEQGITVLPVQGRRTIAEQNDLYAKGRTSGGSVVTNAKGGQSAHNFGLACDLCIVHPETGELWWNAPDDLWQVMADLAVAQGLTAGYYFKSIHDAPHVEDSSWKQQQALWKEGKIKVV